MIRIAITGPESTGKSTLAKQLAAHYQTVWVPEFARGYIAELNRPYTLADLEEIARGQVQSEQELAQKAERILFSDTDLFVMKVWAEHAFGTVPGPIRQLLQAQRYHLHLLMDVDLPWEPDPQREHPHLRQHFLELYRQELTAAGVPFTLISGAEEDRLQRALEAVEAVLAAHEKDRR